LHEQSDEIVNCLKIQTGQHLAEFNAGADWLCFEFARRVGEPGHVFAVVNDRRQMYRIEQTADLRNLPSLTTTLFQNGEVYLPEAYFDWLIFNNVLPACATVSVFFAVMRRFLRPDGRIALINTFNKADCSKSKIIDCLAAIKCPLEEQLHVRREQLLLIFTRDGAGMN
jgi:ubiquinone/menaquinone biosynthesis C-methylase UbiE